MEPKLSAGIAGALFCPSDRVGDHTFATRQLAAVAQKAGGAAIRTSAKVMEVLHDKDTATASG